jgi:DNA helicase-2/ATP-dependent DNA helicase PcrA
MMMPVNIVKDFNCFEFSGTTPGSGKTRVLTYRIARIIEATPDKFFRILGLTFTNKAAAEMRERIGNLVPNASERILLSTFHSFAADILRQHGHLIGLKPDFAILSQDVDRTAILDEVISDTGRITEDPHYTGERILPLVNRLLDYAANEETAHHLLATFNTKDPEADVAIYMAYRKRMIAGNFLDFGGLVAEAIRLLQERPAVRRQIQRIYTYICVDEFQDTNQ